MTTARGDEPEVEAVAISSRKGEHRDPRLDRIISWVLTAGLVIVLGWLSSAFRDLANEVRATRDEVSKIATRVAILERDDATTRLRSLEQGSTEERGHLAELERRVSTLESHGGK